MFDRWSKTDEEIVVDALAATGISDLSGRLVDELSGGQRQRVWVAMVLAQQTPVLLLDEPTTFLDITHQYGLLELFETLRRELDRTIVVVLHDLNQAAPPRWYVSRRRVSNIPGAYWWVISRNVVGSSSNNTGVCAG